VIAASLKTFQVKLTLVRNPRREKSTTQIYNSSKLIVHYMHRMQKITRIEHKCNRISLSAALHLHHSCSCFPKDQKHLHLIHFSTSHSRCRSSDKPTRGGTTSTPRKEFKHVSVIQYLCSITYSHCNRRAGASAARR
jgi:hypothetical protein